MAELNGAPTEVNNAERRVALDSHAVATLAGVGIPPRFRQSAPDPSHPSLSDSRNVHHGQIVHPVVSAALAPA